MGRIACPPHDELEVSQAASGGRYVADFACLEARRLIEIDGYWHAFRKSEDAAREQSLRAAGFDVVRYDIEREPMEARALAEAIAHQARMRIERGV